MSLLRFENLKTPKWVAMTLLCVLAFAPTVSSAQVEMIDPDLPTLNTEEEPEPQDAGLGVPELQTIELPDAGAKDTPLPAFALQENKDGGVSTDAGTAVVVPPKPASDKSLEVEKKAPVKDDSIEVSQIRDADIEMAWQRFLEARAANDIKRERSALSKLLALKDESLARRFEAASVALIQLSRLAMRANEVERASLYGELSITLSPDFYVPLLYQLERQWGADATDFMALFKFSRQVAEAFWNDTRESKRLVISLACAVFIALFVVALFLLAILFFKHISLLIYDISWALRAFVPPWQLWLLTGVVVVTPIFLGLGVLICALFFFGLIAAYISQRERVFIAVLFSLVSMGPLVLSQLTAVTAFWGADLEDLYALERGGPDTERVAPQVFPKVATDNDAAFVYAHYLFRRGRLAESITLFEALNRRAPSDAVLTNLGTALWLKGDAKRGEKLLVDALTGPELLAVPAYNLSRLLLRRSLYTESTDGVDGKRGAQYSAEAIRRDDALSNHADDLTTRSGLLILSAEWPKTHAVFSRETQTRSKQDVYVATRFLLPWPEYAFVLSLGFASLAALGWILTRREPARYCGRCGKVYSRRSDPHVGKAFDQCGQCENVFGTGRTVDAAVAAEKKNDVQVFQRQVNLFRSAFGTLFWGGGHAIDGRIITAGVLAFIATFSLFFAWFFTHVFGPVYYVFSTWHVWLVSIVICIMCTFISANGAIRVGARRWH